MFDLFIYYTGYTVLLYCTYLCAYELYIRVICQASQWLLLTVMRLTSHSQSHSQSSDSLLYLITHRILRLVSPITPFTHQSDQHEQWAIVTGASYGIGKAIAFELAERGLHVALIARSKPKLQSHCAQIRQMYGVQAIAVTADFYQTKQAVASIVQQLDAKHQIIEKHKCRVLINNVGGGVADPFREYLEWTTEEELRVRQLNIDSMIGMTRTVLPGMLNKHDGFIVNIGSLSYMFPAYLVPYASGKAKLLRFSEGLSIECAHRGVHIQCMNSGMVSTPAVHNPMPSVATPSPETFARSAVAMIGHGGPIVTPYWAHAMQAVFIGSMPPLLKRKITLAIFQEKKREFAENKKKNAQKNKEK
jgi:17beta-estradiol 17-dehydrogenase / very-long-chain 3-oxoacyl-CoA reductase